MTPAFAVSRHAQRRYAQRVNACDDPRGLLRLWTYGDDATDDDLSLYRVTRHDGSFYRVGIADNGLRFLMIMRGGVVVTCLEVR